MSQELTEQDISRNLRKCKRNLSTNEYLLECQKALTTEDYFAEYKKLMLEEKIDKDEFFRDCHTWLPLEIFVRELVLCNTKDEFFKDFILYATRVFDRDHIEIAEIRFQDPEDTEVYLMLECMLSLVAAEVKKPSTLRKFKEIFQDPRFAGHLKHYFRLNRQNHRTTPWRRQDGEKMLNEMRRAVDMEINRIDQQRRGYAVMSAMPPGNLSHPYRVLASILSITNDHGAHPTANDEVRKPFLYTTV